MASPERPNGTRNRPSIYPVGIFILFLLIAYSSAALLLGTSGGLLESNQRWVLIFFLTSFPVLVLGAFAWLIAHHHDKFYAPTEPSEVNLLHTISPDLQRLRLEMEIDSLKTNLEESEHKSVASNCILAKDLAITQIGIERGLQVNRQVSLGLGSFDTVFDGVMLNGDKITALDVKFLGRSYAIKILTDAPSIIPVFESALYRVSNAETLLRKLGRPCSICLLLVLVTQMSAEQQDKLKSEARKRLRKNFVPVEIQVLNLDELKKGFGIQES